MQSNPPLELVGRSTSVHGVFGFEVVCRFVEPNPIQLRVHRQAVRDVAFTEFQQIERVGFLAAVARLPDWPAVPVVLDPPDGAAFVRHAHSWFLLSRLGMHMGRVCRIVHLLPAFDEPFQIA
jgi:hypothetical protein